MKKLFALILTVCLLASMSTTAFAANTTGGSTEVSFNVDPTYTVTIPATVELNKVEDNGTVTYENDYTLTAQAGVRLKKGEYIEVTVASDFEMTTTEGATLAYTDVDGYAGAFGGMASAFGNNAWQIGALVICLAITMLGIGKGIEKANKVMMPLFYVLFVGLAIYIAMQPGAAEGYKYIFRVDPVALKDPMTWIYALGQAFFSLSIAGNGTVEDLNIRAIVAAVGGIAHNTP